MNSTNGTHVNGAIKKHVLQSNDVIELGKYRLKYIADGGAAQVADQDASFSQVVRDRQRAPRPPRPGGPARAAGWRRSGAIQILSGTHAGRTLELSKSLTTLGKPGTQVAVITRRPHGYFITHVEGNGFPGGERAPSTPRPIVRTTTWISSRSPE